MTRSSYYSERYRPQFHFSARENWLNDPNGCVYWDGEYHLFFQHNPAGLTWGNMTWGHAISTDLVHWRQGPDAIEPYAGGTIFSGSAVVDHRNTAGFGPAGSSPLVAAFTHAKKPFGQALAFSLDKGRTWTLHDGGVHVVPNQGLEEGERDPKLFWHPPTRRWIMALWVQKNQVRFFTSRNLKEWTHASDFCGDGFYECPDLFPLSVDKNPQDQKWVLLDAAFRYWIGSFDGTRFVADTGPMRGDFVANFYAAQTWSNTEPRVVQIGWMNGGEYPGMPFNQQMSFPCELALRTTSEGIRLCRMPVVEIERLRVGSDVVRGRLLHGGEEIEAGQRGDLFDITLEADVSADAVFGIHLHELAIVCSGGRLHCLGREAALPMQDSTLRLRILVDRTSIEIYANEGEVCMSACFVPLERDTNVRVCAQNGSVRLRSLVVHPLRSAWK